MLLNRQNDLSVVRCQLSVVEIIKMKGFIH